MRAESLCFLLPIVLACRPAPSADTETDTSSGTDETGGDPSGWKIVYRADAEQGALMSVWGPSVDEVYAVGGQPGTPDDPSLGIALRYDAATWSEEELPPDTAMLNWVFGVDGLQVAVGQKGAIVRRQAGTWTSEASPTDRTLWGVWGASPDELWAVGGNGSSDEPVLIVRRAGTWETQAVPALQAGAKGLFKVWGTAEDDVWVVGDRGVTLHYDGSAWAAHETTEGIDLISVWGSDAEGLIAVGGRASGYVGRLEGEMWKLQALPVAGLNGVWVDPNGTTTAVGTQGTILSLEAGGFGYAEETSPTPLSLHATFGFADGPRFAVGGSLLSAPPWTGVVIIDESAAD